MLYVLDPPRSHSATLSEKQYANQSAYTFSSSVRIVTSPSASYYKLVLDKEQDGVGGRRRRLAIPGCLSESVVCSFNGFGSSQRISDDPLDLCGVACRAVE